MTVCVSHSVVSDSLRPHRLQPTRLLCPWNSPSKNTEVSSHCLQNIFVTQGLNLGLLRCRQILYCLSLQGSPKEVNTTIIVCDEVSEVSGEGLRRAQLGHK